MNEAHDLIIIGAGPAGITAAIYAARKKMNFVVVSPDVGGQTAWSGAIENYTGFQFITGPELAQKFDEHIRRFAIPLELSARIDRLHREGGLWIAQGGGKRWAARTVIVATGRVPRKLGVPGEEEFRNRGVAYCATCDGPLFADAEVAVVGGGNSALDAALQMIRIARRVHLIQNLDRFTGDAVMLGKALGAPNLVAHTGTEVVAIRGEAMVTGLVLRHRGKEEDLPLEGVFIEIGTEPVSRFVEGVKTNPDGEIEVDCRCRTNLPGLFAAGDVSTVPAKQVIVAAGEGAKAAISSFSFLSAQPVAGGRSGQE